MKSAHFPLCLAHVCMCVVYIQTLTIVQKYIILYSECRTIKANNK